MDPLNTQAFFSAKMNALPRCADACVMQSKTQINDNN